MHCYIRPLLHARPYAGHTLSIRCPYAVHRNTTQIHTLYTHCHSAPCGKCVFYIPVIEYTHHGVLPQSLTTEFSSAHTYTHPYPYPVPHLPCSPSSPVTPTTTTTTPTLFPLLPLLPCSPSPLLLLYHTPFHAPTSPRRPVKSLHLSTLLHHTRKIPKLPRTFPPTSPYNNPGNNCPDHCQLPIVRHDLPNPENAIAHKNTCLAASQPPDPPRIFPLHNSTTPHFPTLFGRDLSFEPRYVAGATATG